MGALVDWLNSVFGKKPSKYDVTVAGLATEVHFKNLAIQACINLIANTISRAEFLTFERGQQVRRDNYYLLNVEPNPNHNASKFWRDVVSRLVYENEALIVQQDLNFYCADSFAVDRYAFRENTYTDVSIEDFQLNRSYTESEVFHFELHDEKIKTVIDGLYGSYAKLIAASQQHYKRNNARRGILELGSSFPQGEEAQKRLYDLLNNKFRKFFNADGSAMMPLEEGLKYTDLDSNIGVKGGTEGRDIRAFIDDIFDFVAIAFQIPPQLLRGVVADTDKSVNNLLTFCINPLAELLTDEINRKLYGKAVFLARTYCRLDTTRIKAVDIKDIANALDIMIRTGVYCIDDCLMELGREPLGTEWSQARWMTKNYMPIETATTGGG